MEVSGLAVGDRVHNMQGELKITDHINKFEAIITYNPQTHSSYLKRFKNKLWRSSDSHPTDLIAIQIKQKANNN